MELEPLDANALLTTSGLYCDCGYWSDGMNNSTEVKRCDYDFSLPQVQLSRSATFSQYGSPRRAGSTRKRMIMDDGDKGIYNSLGSSSSPSGKVLQGRGLIYGGDWQRNIRPSLPKPSILYS